MNIKEEQLYLGGIAAEGGMQKALEARRVVTWILLAEEWLCRQGAGTEFTADDLIKGIGLPDTGANRNNVIGAWFGAKSKQGHIEFTGEMRKSTRIDRHTGLQRLWRVK